MSIVSTNVLSLITSNKVYFCIHLWYVLGMVILVFFKERNFIKTEERDFIKTEKRLQQDERT